MGTPNLDLQTIEMTDNLKTDFVRKINSNMQTIDEKYLELKQKLLEKTKQGTIEDAIAFVDALINLDNLTATPDKIFEGYTAFINGSLVTGIALSTNITATASDITMGKTAYNNEGQIITGIAKIQPKINITLTGTNASYISNYGAGTDDNGVLTIWALSSSASYGNIRYAKGTFNVGSIGLGWNSSSFSTDEKLIPTACTITGLLGYSSIDIILNATTISADADYVGITVTITAS